MMVAILVVTSIVILVIGYLIAISSRDVIRLLISLEIMFASLFFALIPLFSIENLTTIAFGIAVIAIFTSGCELMALISSIILLDRKTKTTATDSIKVGGVK